MSVQSLVSEEDRRKRENLSTTQPISSLKKSSSPQLHWVALD